MTTVRVLPRFRRAQHFTSPDFMILKRNLSVTVPLMNDRPLDKKIEYPRFIRDVKHGRYISATDLLRMNDRLKSGEKQSETVTLTGRIQSKRESSSKLVFYDIVHNGESVQVVASRSRFSQPDAFTATNLKVSRGDILRFTGVIGKTNHGQISLFASDLDVMTPCLHDIPKTNIRDPEKRFRQRYLDMLVNREPEALLRTRAKIVRYLRDFLDRRDFVEVETPVLVANAGGASAKPFTTKANALSMELSLRIAPELFLKELVIGGLDRVYEIGKQFRNEGIDADHNPEFTTCEFYQAYGNLDSLMDDTETLLSGMVKHITGNNSVEKNNETIRFDRPFARIDVTGYLDNHFGLQTDSVSSMDAKALKLLCIDNGIPIQHPFTEARILDKIISTIIEPQCIQPTFLFNHPLSLSPLAKDYYHNGNRVAARFELFVGKKEIVNAYEELNDPAEQRLRFEQQQHDRQQGDFEAPAPDMAFCEALEYGLPPTAGWGMGIDRLVQLLTGKQHIREVISFPLVRSLENHHQK
ncbi:lysyl-tRNA synthetase [Hesseltinella vesiculosa]|uniref:Lysine--tRNA ligase n=1 Tax=Hesseltinella vesiculosa TaxID=101127 RepID=A0A1X2G4X3_9FUNG|nr:lysyl-tRNA synthetase [Hesseltinella vesiculosa]